VTVVLDTGVLYAYYDADDRWHQPSRDLVASEAGGLVVPSPILPELDHLLGRRLGSEAQRTLYRGIVDGHFFVVDLPRDGYQRVLELNEKYVELGLGFVDAAVIAVAEELGLGRIATTDRRHFTAITAAIPLELLPEAPAS
jgi:predicted nucleic acid-binding protein